MTTIHRNQVQKIYRPVGNLEPIGFELVDNSGAAINLTGLTLKCQGYDVATGEQVITDGTVNITTAAEGKCSYSPDAADVASERDLALYVTDSSNPARWWPWDGARLILVVRQPWVGVFG